MTVNTQKFGFTWGAESARGFADGDAVTVEFDNDTYSTYTGTKGEGGGVISSDKRATITVNLQSTSSTLKGWFAQQKAIELGAVNALPFMFKQVADGVTHTYTGTCAMSKQPGGSANRDMPVKEIIFKSGDCEYIVQ